LGRVEQQIQRGVEQEGESASFLFRLNLNNETKIDLKQRKTNTQKKVF
jgi:hypothetical protein